MPSVVALTNNPLIELGLHFLCRHDTLAGELARLGGRRDRRLAMILGGEQSLIGARHLRLLGLGWRCRYVLFVRGGLLLWRRLSRCSTGAPVEAGSCRTRIDDDRLAVNIGDCNTAKIIDGLVVREHSIVPISALVADAAVTEAVIDAAVETNVRPPVALVPT